MICEIQSIINMRRPAPPLDSSRPKIMLLAGDAVMNGLEWRPFLSHLTCGCRHAPAQGMKLPIR
jgi:hypothetical protein